MQSWLGHKLLSFVMGRTRQGDVRPTLALEHPDVQFTFPGRSSFAGVFAGKAEVSRWLHRFAAIGLQIYPDEVVLKGFPWRTTACIRGHVHFDAPSGERVYENRYVIWGHMAWGRLRAYEVYEDTNETDRLDAWLREHQPGLAVL